LPHISYKLKRSYTTLSITTLLQGRPSNELMNNVAWHLFNVQQANIQLQKRVRSSILKWSSCYCPSLIFKCKYYRTSNSLRTCRQNAKKCSISMWNPPLSARGPAAPATDGDHVLTFSYVKMCFSWD
jgi:hypothetical protein